MDATFRFVVRQHKSFFGHAPDFISRTTNPKEADVFLSHMACDGDCRYGHFSFPTTQEVFFHNRAKWTELVFEIENKPCIFLTEGRIVAWPDWLREFDLVYQLLDCPPRPNLLKSMGLLSEIVDEIDFYQNNIPGRRKYQVAMMNTHEHIRLVAKYARRLIVLGTDDLCDIHCFDAMDILPENVDCMFIPPEQPDKMRNVLNQTEFVISCPIPGSNESIGFEALAIEGMFCGAQPVYSDPNGHFNRIHEGLNVKFIDCDRIEESIQQLIADGPKLTQSDINVGVQRWGCTKRIPAFWEEVRSKL